MYRFGLSRLSPTTAKEKPVLSLSEIGVGTGSEVLGNDVGEAVAVRVGGTTVGEAVGDAVGTAMAVAVAGIVVGEAVGTGVGGTTVTASGLDAVGGKVGVLVPFVAAASAEGCSFA